MRPIMGVRVRGNGLRDDQYRCQRCGIENTFKPCRTTRPTRCFDCKVVEEGWGSVAEPQQNDM